MLYRCYNEHMKNEYELKFLKINKEEIRRKLVSVDATLLKPMRDMKRAVIDSPLIVEKDAFIRIRDEGDKCTLTYKEFIHDGSEEVVEIETKVDSYENTVALFTAAGLSPRSTQESRRETWMLNECEIVIDEWPWIDPYIEIEGPDHDKIQTTAEIIGFDLTEAKKGDVMVAYRQEYPHLTINDTIATLPHVRFKDPLPDLLKPARV